jgi:tetratricopeptide (TPR) repeat protein
MPDRLSFRRFQVFLVLFVAPLPLVAAQPDERAGWDLIARFSARAAEPAFAGAAEGGTPQQRLGLAAVYLGKYPQTPANVDRAEELLHGVLAEAEDRNLRAASLYVLARIAHLFHEDRTAEAAEFYQQLVREYPETRLADTAAVKLALLEFDRLPMNTTQADVFALVDGLTRPRRSAARGNFHQAVAALLLERGELRAGWAHLKAALELDTATGKSRADLLVKTGRVGSLIGETTAARSAYATFMADYPSDVRAYMVQRELEHLSGETAP